MSGAPLPGPRTQDPPRAGEGGRRAKGHGRGLLWACLVALVPLAGCATKSDVRDLRTQIREMQTRQDSLLREMARLQSSVLDSLQSQSDVLFSIRGNLNRQLLEIQEQLVMVQELTGQSQRQLQGIRDEIETRRTQIQVQDTAGPGGEPAGLGGGSAAPDTLFQMGVTMHGRGSLQTARRAFQRFLQTYPRHGLAPDARFYLADILAQQNRLEEAIDGFLEVAELHPSSDQVPEALYRAGLLHLELDREDEARDLFERVVNTYPDSRAADLARQRLEEIG